MRGNRGCSWIRIVVALGAALMGIVAASAPATAIGVAPAQAVAASTVSGASPTTGPVAGGTAVTVSGTGFVPGETRLFLILTGGGWQHDVPASAVDVALDGTAASFVMPEGPAAGGVVGMIVFVSDTRVDPVPTFTYIAPPPPPLPTVTGVTPTTGPVAGGTAVTVSGTGFVPGETRLFLILTGGGWQHDVPASAVEVALDGTAASFVMPEGPAAGGVVGMIVFVSDTRVDPVPTFTYIAPLPPPLPTVTGVTPTTGPVAGGTVVTLSGTALAPDAMRVTLVFSGSGWRQHPVGSSEMTVNTDGTALSFAMPEGPAAGGVVGIIVFTSAGQSKFTPTFTYIPPPPPAVPTVTGIAPTSGPVGGGTVVTLSGTALAPDAMRVLLVFTGSGWPQHPVPASAMTGSTDGTTLSFAMPEGPAGGGLVGVIVFTSAGQSKVTPTFTYSTATAPRQRVAADGVALSSSTSWPVLFAVAMGVLVAGWVAFVVATRRRSTRTTS